ncbi:hypothetical protein NX779_01240 [Mycoplasma cottewii]|uniref:Peptidylprolyl isomerase n=1 Tax=Mycoplasma cottewii TaxID=51364 RepID=A0ABY5U061_9MOLU|nr:hypothetical protein [Mycoplasma cottewii]UWD35246.1 hypothetical protein NX779_01240 [Mycoplasma cottewii]
MTIKVVKSEMYSGHVEVKVLTIKENIQMVNSIWNEGFSGKLIRPIYFGNLVKELNKRLRQKDADEVSFEFPALLDTTIGNDEKFNVKYKNETITLQFGEFMPLSKKLLTIKKKQFVLIWVENLLF